MIMCILVYLIFVTTEFILHKETLQVLTLMFHCSHIAILIKCLRVMFDSGGDPHDGYSQTTSIFYTSHSSRKLLIQDPCGTQDTRALDGPLRLRPST